MKPTTQIIAALLVVAGFGRALSDESKPQPGGSVVPFELIASNHIVVKAKINGKGPYRLIFDLGSPVTLLGNRASEESGVVKADAPKSFLFANRGEAEVEKLQVGDLTAEAVPVLVMDHPLLTALGDILGRRIDGLIGYTFFAHYKTTIDYKARTMTFEPVEFEVRNLMKDLPGQFSAPRVAHHRVLAPGGVWGLTLGEPSVKGVVIASVIPGTPAETAGLKPGDVLTTLDGRWTTSTADTFAAAAGVADGQPATVVVLRDDKELTLTVTPKPGL